MSRRTERQPSLFFGERTTTQLSNGEKAAFASASATGARLAGMFLGWAGHARQVLALHLPQWAGEQPTVPDWLDTEHPEHAWHLICLVAQGLPQYTPPAGAGCDLTRSEQRAAEVLFRMRRVYEAASPLNNRLDIAFPLIEASLSLGCEVVSATVDPYEDSASIHHRALQRMIESNKGTPPDSPNARRRADTEQRNREIRQLAREYMDRVGRESVNEAAEWIADHRPELGLSARQLRRIISG